MPDGTVVEVVVVVPGAVVGVGLVLLLGVVVGVGTTPGIGTVTMDVVVDVVDAGLLEPPPKIEVPPLAWLGPTMAASGLWPASSTAVMAAMATTMTATTPTARGVRRCQNDCGRGRTGGGGRASIGALTGSVMALTRPA